jgi:hypothetical protein
LACVSASPIVIEPSRFAANSPISSSENCTPSVLPSPNPVLPTKPVWVCAKYCAQSSTGAPMTTSEVWKPAWQPIVKKMPPESACALLRSEVPAGHGLLEQAGVRSEVPSAIRARVLS